MKCDFCSKRRLNKNTHITPSGITICNDSYRCFDDRLAQVHADLAKTQYGRQILAAEEAVFAIPSRKKKRL